MKFVNDVKKWLKFSGARGVVEIGYYTEEFTATPGLDYVQTAGRLRFENGDISKKIRVPILNRSENEKNRIFNLYLEEPKEVTSTAARLGDRPLTSEERLVDQKGPLPLTFCPLLLWL